MTNVRNRGLLSLFSVLGSPFSVLRSRFSVLGSPFSVDSLFNSRNLKLMANGGLRYASPTLRIVA